VFEVGAINGVFKLKDEWTKGQIQIYDSTAKTLKLISEIPAVVGKAATQSVTAISKSSNTLNGLNDRVEKLQKLLNKSDIGSTRFKQLSAELNSTQKAIDKVNASFSKTSPIITTAKNALGAFAVIAGAKAILNLGKEAEQTAISYTTFLGSATKAAQVIKNLNKFAVDTPFTSTQVTQAGKALLAFGITANKLIPTLKAVGDVSSATGKDFNELATIYGKARTQGTLFAEDINQLTEAGIPIIEEFSKILKVPPEQIKKLGSEGKITFDLLEKAFQNMTGEGGRFFNLMETQSKSFGGLTSTLLGNLEDTGKSIGGIITDSLKPTIQILITGSEVILKFVNNNKELIKTMLTFATVLGSGILAIKAYTMAMEGLKLVMAILPSLASKAGLAMSAAFGPGSLALIAVATLTTAYITLKQRIQEAEDARAQGQKNINAEIKLSEKLTDSERARVKELRNLGAELLKGKLTNQQTEEYKVKLETVVKTLEKYGVTRAQITKDENFADLGRLDKILKLNDAIKTLTNNLGAPANSISALQAKLKDLRKEFENVAIGTQKFKELKKEIENTDHALKEAQKNTGSLTDVFSGLKNKAAEGLSSISKSIDGVGISTGTALESIGSMMDVVSQAVQISIDNMFARLNNKLQNVQNKAKIFNLLSDVYLKKEQEANQKELDSFTKLQNAELEAFKKSQDAMLEAEKRRADESIALITEEFIKRKQLSDLEFADRKAKADAEFAAFVELERQKYEAQKLKLDQESVDKEQRQNADKLLEEDWKKYLESLQATHNENLLALAQQQSEADVILKQEEDKKKEEQQKANDDRLIALEKAKAEAIAKAEEEKEDRIFKKQEEIKAKEKESNKRVTAVKYAIDVAALEVQKQIGRAQATIALAQGVMQATAMAPMTFGASLALIPLMYNAYSLSMAGISSQFVVPPAELFLNTGGVPTVGARIVPGAGMSDSIPARLTPNEMVVDRETTDGLRTMVRDKTLTQNTGITVNVHSGAFVAQGGMDERAVDAFSALIVRRLERSFPR